MRNLVAAVFIVWLRIVFISQPAVDYGCTSVFNETLIFNPLGAFVFGLSTNEITESLKYPDIIVVQIGIQGVSLTLHGFVFFRRQTCATFFGAYIHVNVCPIFSRHPAEFMHQL